MDRRGFLQSASSLFALGTTSPLLAGAYNEEVSNLLARVSLTSNMTVYAVDMKTGKVLADFDADRPMPLASVAKAFVAAYALDHLGQTFTFNSQIVANKPLNGGRNHGAWTVMGDGDPTFSIDNLSEMIASVAQTGLSGHYGGIGFDHGDFPKIGQIDPSQPSFVSYNPIISGTNLNFNRVQMRWEAGGGLQPNFFAKGRSASVQVGNVVARLSDRNGPVYIYKGQKSGRELWDVKRSALSKAGSRNLPVRNIEAYWRAALYGLAQQNGFQIDTKLAQPTINNSIIAQHISEPLSVIARDMLKYSTNLTAEMLALKAAHAQGLRPGTLDDSGYALQQWLAREYGLRNVSLLNGSGLNENSAACARDLVQFFLHDRIFRDLRPLLKPIEIDRRHGEEQSGKIEIFAKTGTLNFVSALSGYVMKAPDHPIAFAILSADMKRRRSIPEDMRDRPDGGRSWLTRSRSTTWNILRRLVS